MSGVKPSQYEIRRTPLLTEPSSFKKRGGTPFFSESATNFDKDGAITNQGEIYGCLPFD